jgi:apolipoprotein N-acyltransferase
MKKFIKNILYNCKFWWRHSSVFAKIGALVFLVGFITLLLANFLAVIIALLIIFLICCFFSFFGSVLDALD